MPKSGEFYTFDEVIKQLNIDESRLKRLVSEGEIRAFREGDEMKFKKADIDTLDVVATEEGETREIDLAAGGAEASETLTDDLIFDEGDELDLSSDDAGMATAEISSQDTFVDEGSDPIGMSTEPLDFADDGGFEDEEPEEYEDEALAARPSRGARTRRQEEPASAGDALWCVVLGLGLIFMLFAGFVVFSGASKAGMNSVSEIPVKLFAKDDYNIIKGKGAGE
ncbi:MAG: helix-turn-helix domain-containing protein [Planctomycetota bacterium]